MMITLPKYISFVGVDEYTDLTKLNNLYYCTIELGFLLGNQNSGKIRYPSLDFILKSAAEIQQYKLRITNKITTSLHLCGQYAQDYLNGSLNLRIYNSLNLFDTVQINALSYPYEKLAKHNTTYKTVIQFRESYIPTTDKFTFLLDRSGGKGIQIKEFPYCDSDQLVGVAGGININTVESVVQKCPYTNYYLDLESGCRTNDRFDLELCRKIYEKVYY